jgi:hypothetical protein
MNSEHDNSKDNMLFIESIKRLPQTEINFNNISSEIYDKFVISFESQEEYIEETEAESDEKELYRDDCRERARDMRKASKWL